MQKDEFREALLKVMEQKVHWAWSGFTAGLVPKNRLHIHLEQEYATYVRDFPVLVARGYVQCPVAEVRRELVENIYEEETGGLNAGRPHPELFLEYPRGLGMDLERFAHVTLLPGALKYREFIDQSTLGAGWEVATGITTLFIEGTSWERGELDASAPKRPEPPLEQHPLVQHYGLPLESLALAKAHRSVEGSHRGAAWRVLLDFVPPAVRPRVVRSLETALLLWLEYRDDVAGACGLEPGPDRAPRRIPGLD